MSYLLSGAFYLSHTGVTSFYGRAAAAADCGTLRLPADERGMCPTPAQQAQGPDWLEYAPGSPIRPFYRNLPRDQVDNLISDFNHRVLSQQPGRLLGAYARDMIKPFALTRDGALGDTPISRWQFQLRFPYNPPHESMAFVHAAISQFGGGDPAVWRPVATFLRGYQLHGGYTPGPLLALCVLAGLAGSLALLRRRGDPGTRQLGLACLLFLLSGVAVLLASDLFEFSWRYQLPAWSRWCRPARWGSASSSACSGPRLARAAAEPGGHGAGRHGTGRQGLGDTAAGPRALAAAATAGPYFTIQPWSPGAGWQPFGDLLADPAVLPERVGQARAVMARNAGCAPADVPPRVAASVLFLGLAAQLVSPLLGAAVLAGVLPRLAVADLYWRRVPAGPWPLAARPVGGTADR